MLNAYSLNKIVHNKPDSLTDCHESNQEHELKLSGDIDPDSQ